MFARAAKILNEAVMGFLALAALSLGLVPLLFPVTPGAAMVLDAAEWIVVGLFALEFVAHLSIAPDRGRFLRDPWRLLDAAILLAALGSLLPFVSDSARNMLALRILRLFRALLFGFRAGRGLHESSYPRLDAGPKWTALTLSLPSGEDVQRRDPVMLLISRDDLLSMALQPLDLQQAPAGEPSIPWGPRCALDIVRRVLSMARGDLWRLRSLLEMLSDGRRSLPGLPAEGKEAAGRLAEEADFLYETVDNLRESVLSLIDLHINMAAHDTNRFMRLVAIASTLGLIPAITGGLLGMNLLDSPWPVTLGQVAFATLVLILGVLYAFLAKGWLR